MKISVFWFRRDLRLEDNVALRHALQSGLPVLPVFIFDLNILKELPRDDARVNFIYDNLYAINSKIQKMGSSVLCLQGDPVRVWEDLISKYDIDGVFVNKDYEPYAINRDEKIKNILKYNGVELHTYKDQVIFEEDEILKKDGTHYTVFTPYKNKWLSLFNDKNIDLFPKGSSGNYLEIEDNFPSLSAIGFEKSDIKVKDYNLSCLNRYSATRDFPAMDATSYLSPHLRFGTISIRQLISGLKHSDDTFLSELIWREFFKQILFAYSNVVTDNFKPKYNRIKWRNNKQEFEHWCNGTTGYPMVDAGMRQLNETGYMHNRVRMVTAGFLCKHLLIDWRWGEAYFAKKLLDYDLSSNNGNWQLAAGTGCDAAPYFRIFNPIEQLKKFDKDLKYIRTYVPEYGTRDYVHPIVEHKFARTRALEAYKQGLRS